MATATLENQTYYRLSGAGNDFIAFAAPAQSPTIEQRQRLCARGTGLGADGLLLLHRAEEGVIRLDYFNADGERAELCVNGTRSAAQLAFRLGWAQGRARLMTDVGELDAVQVSDTRVRLAAPGPGAVTAASLTLGTETIVGHACVVGVPHLIVEVDDLEACDVTGLGAALRAHPSFGDQGTNVDFVRFAGDRFALRTFERGVEGETLACGSGMLAAAAVGLHLGRIDLPVDVATRSGCVLCIAGSVQDSTPHDWTLEGDARVLARGEIWSL